MHESGIAQTMEDMIPVKKTALALLLALCTAPAALMAQVVVRIAPPAPVVEVHDHPPHAGWVWNDGYQRWDGHRYVWTKGRWVKPPHPGAVWVAHRWERRNGGYVMVEGHWR
jgi:WXXGXW repeat (2 copies)